MNRFASRAFLAAVLLALTGAAPATAGWSAPQSLGAAVAGSTQFAPDGSAHVALSDWAAATRGPKIEIAAAAPGAPFAAPLTIFSSTLQERAYGGDDLGFDAAGGGVLLTRRFAKPYPRVRAILFAADGSASAPRTISSPGHTARIAFDNLGVAPNGRALATWLQYEGRDGGWHLEGAWRAPGADRFGTPVRISPRLESSNVITTADVTDGGDALVSWRSNGRSGTTSAAIARAGGDFAAPQELGPTGFAMKTALNADGTIVVAESVLAKDGPGAVEELRLFAAPPAAAALGAPQVLPAAAGCDCGESVENLGLALSPGGRVALVAGHAGAGFKTFELRVFEGSAGGTLTQTATVGAGEHGHSGAAIATTDAGDVLVGFGQPVASHAGDPTAYSRFALARKPAGGSFGALELLGDDVGSADTTGLAFSGAGALAIWDSYRSNTREHSVLASRLTP